MRTIIFSVCLLLLSAAACAQTTDFGAAAKTLVSQMTVEEKASLCSGRDFWSTRPVDRLKIPSIFMTDGPHGIRKAQGSDFMNSAPATCFPTASAVAASWNPGLARRMGEAIGQEAQALDVQIVLGPGVNMKRSPLGGRNFEYFSEDPILAGNMGVELVNGIQSQGVGTSLKHFAANNQEFERMSNNSVLDNRTFHEIYLPAFEMVVKQAKPWTVMCSYNLINGVYASENKMLLTDILRKNWGFKGVVMSDWGAVNERVAGVKAGLNLEMPGGNPASTQKVVDAVKKGDLSETDLNESVTDMLALTLQTKAGHKTGATFDKQAHHDLAREVAGEALVLLKNDRNILPLKSPDKKIAVIGTFAKTPRYQGGGSSHMNPTMISNAYDELTKLLGKTAQLSYAAGYNPETDADDHSIEEAVQAASKSTVAIVFAGLPDSYESEGFDRSSLNLPPGQNRLIEAVAKAQPNTIVVLMNGSAIAMPWAGKVGAIVEAWLTGQAGGGAIADVLTGKVNPSGKIAETFPVRLEDTPTALEFPGRGGVANYGEGIFIGYRYYDKKKIEPMFPFGFGLSYTTFAYTGIKIDKTSMKDSETANVTVTVKNTGKVAGKEVVELYVHNAAGDVIRPEKELKHFAKVALNPGEEKTVTFAVSFRDFAYYNTGVNDWVAPTGSYDILVGGSSQQLPLKQTLAVQSTQSVFPKLTRMSLLKELAANPKGKPVYDQMLAGMAASFAGDQAKDPEALKKSIEMAKTFFNDLPIAKMVNMSQGKFTEEMMQGILMMVNQ
jgi:beta-glucosidase